MLIRGGHDPADFANCTRDDLLKSGLKPDFSPRHIDFPWTQSFFALLGVLPRGWALTLFRCLQIFCLISCIVASIHYLNARFHVERLLGSVLVLLFFQALYVRTDFNVANTGLFTLFGFFLLHCGWSIKKYWLEAVGLTILCVKPQTGFLFVLLLLLEKHFRTLLWTGAYCFLIAVPGMLYLHNIPWDFFGKMLAFKYNFAQEPQTCGLFGVFYQSSLQTLIMACNAIAAIALLIFYRLRCPVKDPMLRLLPAAIGTIFWSYSRFYDFLFLIVPLLCLTGMLKEKQDNIDASCKIILLMLLIWCPIMHHFPAYIFLMKYLIAIFALFYIGRYFSRSSALENGDPGLTGERQ